MVCDVDDCVYVTVVLSMYVNLSAHVHVRSYMYLPRSLSVCLFTAIAHLCT